MKPAQTHLLLLLFLLVACYGLKKDTSATTDSFLAIKIVSEMPFDILNDSILTIKDIGIIYNIGKYSVYEEIINPTTNIFNEGKIVDSIKVIAGEQKVRYYVSKDSLRHGVYVDPLTNRVSEKIPVDSFKQRNTLLYSFESFQNNFMVKYKFLKRTINKEEEIVNYFIPHKSGERTMADTICYYYTKEKSFTKANYHLAANSDTIKNYKLYKFTGIFSQLDYPDSRSFKIRNEINLFFTPFLTDKANEIKSVIKQSGL